MASPIHGNYRYAPVDLPAGFTSWYRDDTMTHHIYHRPTRCHGRGLDFMDALRDLDDKLVAFQTNRDNNKEYDDGSGPLLAAAKQGHTEDG